MRRTILALLVLCTSLAMGQFNESAPWMVELRKQSDPTARAQNSPYTLDEINEAFLRYWEGKDPTAKGSGFKPYMRWENYWQHLVDAEGNFPTPAEFVQSWKNKQNTNKAINPTSDWSSLGPFVHDIYPCHSRPGKDQCHRS